MIQVKNLTKNYDGYPAVSDLSFTIEKGKIYGFLGPNGAGKSTTMNIMAGCLAASSGQVLINGHDIYEEGVEAKRHLGYLPELPPLYQDMTAREYLRFVGEMKGLRGAALRSQVEEVLQLTDTQTVAGRLIRQLSKGYKQRLGVAQAILGHPDVIILDEPTVGLDPKQIMEIRDLIRRLGQEHTVILSSHILSEVRAICDEIIIISKGRLVAVDTPENLERLFAGNSTLELLVRCSCQEASAVVEGIGGVQKLECEALEEDRCKLILVSDRGEELAEDLFFAFAEKRFPILSMVHSKASLEEVFLELTEGEAGEDSRNGEKGEEA